MVLKKMEKDLRPCGVLSDDIINGKRVERYLYALYVKEECLLLPRAERRAPKFIQEKHDIGYDYKIGELRGAISVIIPGEIAEQQYASQRYLFHYRRFRQYRVNRVGYFPDNRKIYETSIGKIDDYSHYHYKDRRPYNEGTCSIQKMRGDSSAGHLMACP